MSIQDIKIFLNDQLISTNNFAFVVELESPSLFVLYKTAYCMLNAFVDPHSRQAHVSLCVRDE